MVWARRARRFLGFLLEQTAMAHEDSERVRRSDVKTGEAVEKAAPQHVGAEKPPAGPKHGRSDGKARALRLLLPHVQVGERDDLRHVAREGGKGMVMQVAAQ